MNYDDLFNGIDEAIKNLSAQVHTMSASATLASDSIKKNRDLATQTRATAAESDVEYINDYLDLLTSAQATIGSQLSECMILQIKLESIGPNILKQIVADGQDPRQTPDAASFVSRSIERVRPLLPAVDATTHTFQVATRAHNALNDVLEVIGEPGDPATLHDRLADASSEIVRTLSVAARIDNLLDELVGAIERLYEIIAREDPVPYTLAVLIAIMVRKLDRRNSDTRPAEEPPVSSNDAAPLDAVFMAWRDICDELAAEIKELHKRLDDLLP